MYMGPELYPVNPTEKCQSSNYRSNRNAKFGKNLDYS